MPATRKRDSTFVPYVEETLVASAARTTSSQTAALTGFGAADKLLTQLIVTAASGTTPTLNVVIEDTLDAVNWRTIVTFPQKTAAGFTATDVQQVLPAAVFADRIRVRWTIAGTTPSFTFQVVCASWVD